MSKNLILYFSRPGENYFGGEIKEISKGNTEKVAEIIQEAVGGDLFKIETVEEYPNDYYETVDISRKELKEKARPKLKKMLDNVNDYDNIVIAGPVWCGTFPMAVFSQLDNLNLSGKNLFPVTTHEGSGLARTKSDLKNYKDTNVKDGLAVNGSKIEQSTSQIKSWAEKNLS